MKIDDLLSRLTDLGFSFGILQFNRTRIDFSAMIPGRNTLINIYIPRQSEGGLYSLVLKIEDRIIIDELLLDYLDFKSHLKRMEVYISDELYT